MKKTIVSMAFLVTTVSLWADEPVQLSLTPDIALYPKTTMIQGFALNVWGENPQKSFNLGFINGSTGDSGGFSVGLINYDESYNGVQWGVVNFSRESFVGWQDGWVNVALGSFEGYESGLVNYAENTTGFQLGLVNYAQQLDGLQIGFINVAMNNPWFTDFPNKLAQGFPIVNWSF